MPAVGFVPSTRFPHAVPRGMIAPAITIMLPAGPTGLRGL